MTTKLTMKQITQTKVTNKNKIHSIMITLLTHLKGKMIKLHLIKKKTSLLVKQKMIETQFMEQIIIQKEMK